LNRIAWSPPPLIKSSLMRWTVYLSALVLLMLMIMSVNINPERILLGLDKGLTFLIAFLQPDFISRHREIVEGIGESLSMTMVSTIFGILLSIPIGLGGAKNISHPLIYYICKGIISVSRSFQEIIIAIFFVASIGFGPLAGVFTLSFASIGFLGKLLSEAIEEIDPMQLEAMRSTGAVWLSRIDFAVKPQVLPRFIGLCLYRLDINFRESAVIGIVGAGGIGATLNTSIDRYEYQVSAAILLTIIIIVMGTEYLSGIIRKRLH
jgi:phosphonate transport system permease protein